MTSFLAMRERLADRMVEFVKKEQGNLAVLAQMSECDRLLEEAQMFPSEADEDLNRWTRGNLYDTPRGTGDRPGPDAGRPVGEPGGHDT